MLEQHLEKLVAFVGVVEAGSIRKYALSRRLSQPGVSQRVSALERQLGLPLLHRSRNGIELTKHGRLIYQLGQRLIEESRAAEVGLFSGDLREMEIAFGTYDSVAIYLMPTVIKELQQRLPHVRLKLVCDRSASVLRALEEGTLDCGLCMVSKKSNRIEVKTLFEDSYGFYKSAGAPAGDTLITVLDAHDNGGKTIAAYLKSYGLSKVHVLSVPSFEVAKAMTVSGLGLGILPHRVAAQGLQQGLLKRASLNSAVPVSFGAHSFGFARRKGLPESPEFRMLAEILSRHRGLLAPPEV